MGILVQKDDDLNQELSKRINADLLERARKTSQISDPDFVEDSDYAEKFQKTGKHAWVWIALVVLALGLIVGLVMF